MSWSNYEPVNNITNECLCCGTEVFMDIPRHKSYEIAGCCGAIIHKDCSKFLENANGDCKHCKVKDFHPLVDGAQLTKPAMEEWKNRAIGAMAEKLGFAAYNEAKELEASQSA